MENDSIEIALDHFKVRKYSRLLLTEDSPLSKYKLTKDDTERGVYIIEARILLFQSGLISKQELLEGISDYIEFFFIEPWIFKREDPVVKALFLKWHEDDDDSQFEVAIKEKKIEIIRGLGLGDLLDAVMAIDSEKIHTERIKSPALEDIIAAYDVELAKSESNGMYFSGVLLIGAIIEARLLQVCCRRAESLDAYLRINGKSKYKIKNINQPSGWTLESMINILSDIGVIKSETTDYGELDCSKLAHIIRDARNLIHPNRALECFRKIELIDQLYWDAKAALSILIHQISKNEVLLSDT